MIDLNATSHKIGEIKIIENEVRKVQVGAFVDKNGECFTQLKWYRVSGKEARKWLENQK